MKQFVKWPVLAGWGSLMFFGLVMASMAGEAKPRQVLSTHLPRVARQGHPAAPLAGTNQLHLAISLPARNPAELAAFLQRLQDPTSLDYHHYLTPDQFADRFGATAADYQTVVDFAETNGLHVTGRHRNRLLVEVAGTAADIEKALHVHFQVYAHPAEPRTFFAPDTDPSVDGSLPVTLLQIDGLDNFYQPHPASLHAVPPVATGSFPNAGSGPNSTFLGKDFRLAYANGTTLNGNGQAVALLEFDGYYASDIAAYNTLAGMTNIPLTNIKVNGGVTAPGANNDEVALDIEMAEAMAPGLAKVLVYEAPGGTSWITMLSQIANDNLAHQISSSWGYGGNPNAAAEVIFQQMAAQGQSYFNAAGDDEAYTGNPPFPFDSPNVTSVGGTTLTTAARGGTRTVETVWNWGPNATTGIYTGTGGGVSPNYALPTWQMGINSFATNGGSTTARNVPDVALTADNIYVKYGNGQGGTFGGTSCAAPLWAGFMALVNQKAAAAGLPAVGFINPLVYEMANESTYSSNFFDITTGNNTWSNSPNAFYAVTNYDLCTGVGTPRGTNLINSLASPDPLVVISNNGFKAVGLPAGGFNLAAQTFFLTNAGKTPLNWSLVNTSAWLLASKTSGTLATGTGDQTTLSLSPLASNLPPATYTATLSFSNVTSHVGHYRYFALTTVDPLQVQLPATLQFATPPGGGFQPATLTFILSNPSASPLNWSLNNPAPWLTVAPATGSLAPGAQTTLTVTPTWVAGNLADGYHYATLQITNLNLPDVQTVTVSLDSGLVQNGGFETGDFANWTLTGNTVLSGEVYNEVVKAGVLVNGAGAEFVHAGTYGAFLGDTSLATLAQTLPTTPGQSYLVSLWLVNPQAGTNQEFFVDWDDSNGRVSQIFDVTNPPALAWTNLTFTLTATGTNTTLLFGAQNPPDAFGLDDVTVTLIAPPVFSTEPTNVATALGGTATFSAAVTGTTPMVYQWSLNGTNLTDGGGLTGSATPVLTLAGVSLASAGSYTLNVTNAYGAATSVAAMLTVGQPPAIPVPLADQTVQCGSALGFTIAATGTPPLAYQWVLDGATLPTALDNSLSLPGLAPSAHTLAVIVANLFGSVTNTFNLTVADSLPPVITLNGANPFYLPLGTNFIDPGATANDLCAGPVPVTLAGSVNTSVAGTNVLTFSATDGNGNTSTTNRVVIVVAPAGPVITWSFTNLVLAADTNCTALLPDVTGTNFILATDPAGPVTITQSPTNNAPLSLGTNLEVTTVTGAGGRTVAVTNWVVVADQTPPVLVTSPLSVTNLAGTPVSFSVEATACTPLSYQWYLQAAALPGATNATLTLASVGAADAGDYWVLASGVGGATTSAVATLTVVLPAPPSPVPQITSVAANPDGSISLNLAGTPGYNYILESTTNLWPPVFWLPIQTNALGTNQAWLFTDWQATNFPQQFYRLRSAP